MLNILVYNSLIVVFSYVLTSVIAMDVSSRSTLRTPTFCLRKVRLQAKCCGQNGNNIGEPLLDDFFSGFFYCGYFLNKMDGFPHCFKKWSDQSSNAHAQEVNEKKCAGRSNNLVR